MNNNLDNWFWKNAIVMVIVTIVVNIIVWGGAIVGGVWLLRALGVGI